jgi:hypothetical protein
MFYIRINKIKIFNNREGFLGLFNRAEMRIYSYATASSAGNGLSAGLFASPLTLADMLSLTDEQRKEKLLEAVQTEIDRLAQSSTLAINRVKDNQSLMFGDSGLVIFQSNAIPDVLNMQLWVIESDDDIRQFTLDIDKVIDSDAFKGLLVAVTTALTVTNPVLSGIIGIGAVVTGLLRQKLRANKDDLVGYWQTTLNRAEHYPHGSRDRQDTADTTGNILVDYTLFGFENTTDLPASDLSNKLNGK